jgi:hypothetical protein
MTAGLYAITQEPDRSARSALASSRQPSYSSSGRPFFSFARRPALRVAVALIFAVPAALAGYYATFGLSGFTMTSDLWRQVFAVVGAVAIGATAWTRRAAAPLGGPAGSGRPALS